MVKGRLVEESRGMACLLNDAAADKRALQAQCDAQTGEASAMMLKLQVLWDEKEALEGKYTGAMNRLEDLTTRLSVDGGESRAAIARMEGELFDWGASAMDVARGVAQAESAAEGLQLRLRHIEQQWQQSVERELAARKHQTQQKLHRIICRIKHSGLVNCLELWRETAQEQSRLRLKSEKIVNRIKYSCLVSCLELWRVTAQERIQTEKKLNKIVYRIKNSSIVRCYELWRETAQEQVCIRQKLQKVIFRIKCACLVSTFELWREHYEESVNEKIEQELQQTQEARHDMLVKRSQNMIKRWLVRSSFAAWRAAVIKAREESQCQAMAALEEEMQKSQERARALEARYTETHSDLQRAAEEREEAERQWEAQQEAQHESLVKRSQIFMKRWCLRSHLAVWTQTYVAARQQRLQDDVTELSAEKARLAETAEEEKSRLVSEKERLQQTAGVERSSLSSELAAARQEVQQLSAALADLQCRHDEAVSEATSSSARSAALGRQTSELSACVAETSAQLEAAQTQVQRLTAEVEVLKRASETHEGRAGTVYEEMIELKSQHSALSAQLAAKTAEHSRLDIEMAEVRGELESACAVGREMEEQLSLAREDGEERESILAELQAQTLPALQAELVEKDITVKWLRAQMEAAAELQEHSKKEAAASEGSIAHAWGVTKEAREQVLARDATIRQLSVELSDSSSNVQRLEKTETSLRDAVQNLKDTVAQLREAEIKAHEMYVDLQARKDEADRRIGALVDENTGLQKDKAEMSETSLRDRNEMRALKQRLGEFEERAKDLESVVEREQAELNRQRAARKETEKHNTALMERNTEIDKSYKDREASAVKALSDQLQKLKDGARQQLEDVTAACGHKLQDAEGREREARQALAQCQIELHRLLDERKSHQVLALGVYRVLALL
jgi:chromosome segregation ATPase